MPDPRGFFALPRGVLSQGSDAWFPGDWLLACIYASLACSANWANATTVLPRQKIPLKTGQLLYDRRGVAKTFAISEQVLRTKVKRLTHLEKINPQTSPQGTIITICNYVELFLNWPDDQPTKQPTTNPRSTHAQPYQDIKDIKDIKDKILTRARKPRLKIEQAPPSPQDEARQIGRLVYMPVDRGEGKARFVDLVALDACMDRAVAEVGIEPLRALRAEAEAQGILGRRIFDPNKVLELCRKFLSPVEDHR